MNVIMFSPLFAIKALRRHDTPYNVPCTCSGGIDLCPLGNSLADSFVAWDPRLLPVRKGQHEGLLFVLHIVNQTTKLGFNSFLLLHTHSDALFHIPFLGLHVVINKKRSQILLGGKQKLDGQGIFP